MKKYVVFYLSSLLCIVLFKFSLVFRCLLFSSNVCVGETYSFAIFGVVLDDANCKCVWLFSVGLKQTNFH